MSTTVPAAPPVLVPLDALQAAATTLESRGRSVRWEAVDCCGEADLRLLVRAEASVACVEVLVPDPGTCWWDAVCEGPAGRLLWRGPRLERSEELLVAFIEDLLTGDVERLTGRYRVLG